MAEYFSTMKAITYSFESGGANNVVVKDIFTRSSLIRSIFNDVQAYYKYTVQDGDTPEIVAHKYYGDVKKHWLVMFSNYIVDPYYQFPLSEENFKNYIIAKYGSIENAQTTQHHVDDIRFITNVYDGISDTRFNTVEASEWVYDPATKEFSQRALPPLLDVPIDGPTETFEAPDGTTCILESKLVAISNYDYEYYVNESRRNIRLLDVAYAGRVENELKTIMGK